MTGSLRVLALLLRLAGLALLAACAYWLLANYLRVIAGLVLGGLLALVGWGLMRAVRDID
jgi:hypothetical protein